MERITLDSLCKDIARCQGGIESIGQFATGQKVYYDTETGQFWPSAGVAKSVFSTISSWVPFASGACDTLAWAAEAGARTWYQESYETTLNGLKTIEQETVDALINTNALFNTNNIQEAGCLIELVDRLKDAITSTASRGLNNLKFTYSSHANSAKVNKIADAFLVHLLQELISVNENMAAKLTEKCSVLANTEPHEPKPIIDIVNADFENAEVVIAADDLQVKDNLKDKLSESEKRRLNSFTFMGQSLKAFLGNLSSDGCYCFAKYIIAWVDEKNGKSISLSMNDPAVQRLAPLYKNNDLLDAMNSLESKHHNILVRLVCGYYHTYHRQ
jgi:hypothetical protein